MGMSTDMLGVCSAPSETGIDGFLSERLKKLSRRLASSDAMGTDFFLSSRSSLSARERSCVSYSSPTIARHIDFHAALRRD